MRNLGRAVASFGTYLALSSCSPVPPSPDSGVDGAWFGDNTLFQRQTENGRVTITQIGVGDDKCVIDTTVTAKGTAALILQSKTILTRGGAFSIDDRNGDDASHTELKPNGKDKWVLNGVPVKAQKLPAAVRFDFAIANQTCTDVTNGIFPDFDPKLEELRNDAGRAFMRRFPRLSTT